MGERVGAPDIVNGEASEVEVFFQDSLEDTQGFIKDLYRLAEYMNPPTVYASFFTNGRWAYSTKAQHHNPITMAAAMKGVSQLDEIGRLQIGGECEDIVMHVTSHTKHRDNYETMKGFLGDIMEILVQATGAGDRESLTAQVTYPDMNFDRRNPYQGKFVKFDSMLPPQLPERRTFPQ